MHRKKIGFSEFSLYIGITMPKALFFENALITRKDILFDVDQGKIDDRI